jgi:hypothetical protein
VSDRDAILERVRGATSGRVAHPGRHQPAPGPGGWEAFAACLREVGGSPHGPVGADLLADTAASLAQRLAGGGRIAAERAAADLLGTGPWQVPAADADPHSFADVAVAIVPGRVGVAENAAVAIEGRRAVHRSLAFLCEHLIVLLPEAAIFADMHRAMAALPRDATHFHHLTWISGPSKTADIELALVVGAHGPFSVHVIGYQPG